MSEWITTKHAMQILGVGSTTIKRWADAGILASSRTAGGHRRFRIDAVKRMLGQHPAIYKDQKKNHWVELLTEEKEDLRMRSEISQLRDRLGDWYRTADYLEHVMRRIRSPVGDVDESDSWGQIATGRLSLAISAISRSIVTKPALPVGFVASIDERRASHTLSLIQLCARTDGIELLRADAMTPVNELISQIRSWDQRVLVLCGADQYTDHDLLSRVYRDISVACQEKGVELVIGFADMSSDLGDYGHRCRSFEELRVCLSKIKLEPEAAPEKRI